MKFDEIIQHSLKNKTENMDASVIRQEEMFNYICEKVERKNETLRKRLFNNISSAIIKLHIKEVVQAALFILILVAIPTICCRNSKPGDKNVLPKASNSILYTIPSDEAKRIKAYVGECLTSKNPAHLPSELFIKYGNLNVGEPTYVKNLNYLVTKDEKRADCYIIPLYDKDKIKAVCKVDIIDGKLELGTIADYIDYEKFIAKYDLDKVISKVEKQRNVKIISAMYVWRADYDKHISESPLDPICEFETTEGKKVYYYENNFHYIDGYDYKKGIIMNEDEFNKLGTAISKPFGD